MKPRTNYLLKVTKEDEDRLQEATKAIKAHLPNVDEDKAICHLRVFFWLERAPAPINPTPAKKALEKLKKTNAAYCEALKEVECKLNLQADLSLLDVDFQHEIDSAFKVEIEINELLNKLSGISHWPEKPNAELEAIIRLAAIYKNSTASDPAEGFKHERDHDTYYGPFFDLVRDTFYALDIDYREGQGLGALIKRALKQLSRDNDNTNN